MTYTKDDDFFDRMYLKWRTTGYNRELEQGELMNEGNRDPKIERDNWEQLKSGNIAASVVGGVIGTGMYKAAELQAMRDSGHVVPPFEPIIRVNLKDAVGATKAPLDCVPPAAILALGAAMADGGKKYEPFNYRESLVKASVFHNAKMRHSLDWWDGEDFAPDSLVHHLAHEMACCAILIDALTNGNFVDDRPKKKVIGVSRRTEVWKKAKPE